LLEAGVFMDAGKQARYRHFNDIIVETGSLFFDIQLKQGQYVADLLAGREAESIPVSIAIPRFNGETFDTLHTEKIYFDEERDLVVVAISELTEPLSWDEIDTVYQNEILQALHADFVSRLNYDSLTDRGSGEIS
jgi:hypothetical protein